MTSSAAGGSVEGRGPAFELPAHAAEVMGLLGFPDGADTANSLFWRTDEQPMKLFMDCSDVFWWATADLEEITEEDMPLLRSCFEDLDRIDARSWLPELYAARKRAMRPMGQFVARHLNANDPLLGLFLAAGPERTDSPIPAASSSDDPGRA